MKKNMMAAAAVFVLLLSACGKDKDPGTTPPNPSMEAITDIATLMNATDRKALVGRKVDIPSLTVGRITGFYIFWSGDVARGVPIARYDKLNAPAGTTHPVRTGGTAAIKGTVRLPENVDPNDQIFKTITAQERSDLLSAQIYIAADSVTPR
jgi:hypothetical protein